MLKLTLKRKKFHLDLPKQMAGEETSAALHYFFPHCLTKLCAH